MTPFLTYSLEQYLREKQREKGIYFQANEKRIYLEGEIEIVLKDIADELAQHFLWFRETSRIWGRNGDWVKLEYDEK